MTPVFAFSLAFDAGLSLLGAWALVGLATRLVACPRLARFVLVVPFVKVVVDVGRAFLADAFVTSPFAAERWDLGRFQIGAGVTRPFLVGFHGQLGALAHGRWFSLSAGDLVATFLARKIAPAAPALLAGVALAIGLALGARRLVAAAVFERARRQKRALHSPLAVSPTWRASSLRKIDVYVDDGDACAPFTGGLFHPYIAVPRTALARLDPLALEAALLHEIAHVRAFDAPRLFAIGLASDLLWFVPGIARLVAAARDAAERGADRDAVRAGADPIALAAAISGLAAATPNGGALGVAGGKTLARVRDLLAPAGKTSSFRTIAGGAFVVVASAGALASTFLTKL